MSMFVYSNFQTQLSIDKVTTTPPELSDQS